MNNPKFRKILLLDFLRGLSCNSALFITLFLCSCAQQSSGVSFIPVNKTPESPHLDVPFQPVYAVGSLVDGAVRPSIHLALVIGNDSYPGKQELHRARMDAQRVGNALSSKGFTLIGGGAQLDLTAADINRAVTALERAAAQSPGALVVVYYAGHGTVKGGRNLIEPTDPDSSSAAVEGDEPLSVGRIAERLTRARTLLNVIFFDACRDAGSSQNETYVPERISDNTFVGYSTRFGGFANDENSAYANAIADEIQKGFKSLADMHLSVMRRVFNPAPQMPVFSVGPHMPSFPVSFYPSGFEAERNSSDNLDPELSRRCDRLSKHQAVMGVYPNRLPSEAIVSERISVCIKAWDAGWRSKEVLRGIGSSPPGRLDDRFAYPFTYTLQAAELGDGPAAADVAIIAAIDETESDDQTTHLSGPVSHLLLEGGISGTGLLGSNVSIVREYAFRLALSSDDEFVKFNIAVLMDNPKTLVDGDIFRGHERKSNLGKQALIDLAENGYPLAVSYIISKIEEGEAWPNNLPLRTYLIKAAKRGKIDDEYVVTRTLTPYLFVKESLFLDFYVGKYGPVSSRGFIEFGRQIEREFPYFVAFNNTNGLVDCAALGIALITGSVLGGEPVQTDTREGLRLLKYAAAHGNPSAQQFLNALQFH